MCIASRRYALRIAPPVWLPILLAYWRWHPPHQAQDEDAPAAKSFALGGISGRVTLAGQAVPAAVQVKVASEAFGPALAYGFEAKAYVATDHDRGVVLCCA